MIIKEIISIVFFVLFLVGSSKMYTVDKIDILIFSPLLILQSFILMAMVQSLLFTKGNLFNRLSSTSTRLAKSWFVDCVLGLIIFQLINVRERHNLFDSDSLFDKSLLIPL